MDVPLACRCGAFRGKLLDVTPRSSNRATCYCDDCQCFALHVGAEGTLDARGGTELFQVSSGRLVIEQGHDHLAAVRLSPKGMVRWYAACCRTPIGNTVLKPRLPFIGVIHTIVDLDRQALDAPFGPGGKVSQTKFAKGGAQGLGESLLTTVGLVLKLARLIGRGWWARDVARDPLYAGGPEPVVAPNVLSQDERNTLRARVGGAR